MFQKFLAGLDRNEVLSSFLLVTRRLSPRLCAFNKTKHWTTQAAYHHSTVSANFESFYHRFFIIRGEERRRGSGGGGGGKNHQVTLPFLYGEIRRLKLRKFGSFQHDT